MDNPKTRQEKKSKGKYFGKYHNVYNQKAIRSQELVRQEIKSETPNSNKNKQKK
jgi:hypothetical protein